MTAAKRTTKEQGAESKKKVAKQNKTAAKQSPARKENASTSTKKTDKTTQKDTVVPAEKSSSSKKTSHKPAAAKSASLKDPGKTSAKVSRKVADSNGTVSASGKTVNKKKSPHATPAQSSSPSKKNHSSKPAHPVKKKSSVKKKSHPSLEFPTTTWGTDSVISFEATEHFPPMELTSIAGGFVFHKDSVVLANIPGRGWEIIGGRIDLGETPEDTFRREAMSQIGVTLSNIKMLGVIRIEHFGLEPPNCPYPFPVGYGVQYIGIVEELLPFNGSSESLGRSLISMEGFKEHYYDWNEYFEAVFKYACDVYNKWRKKLKL